MAVLRGNGAWCGARLGSFSGNNLYIIYFVDPRLRLGAARAVSLIATPGE